MTKTATVALALLVAGCATQPTQSYEEFLANREERLANALRAAGSDPMLWRSTNNYSVASGNKSCVIEGALSNTRPLTVIVTQTLDGARFAAATAIDGDGIFPGSTFYLNVDGRRFQGEEKIELSPDVLAAMRQGKTADFEWSPWPRGGYRQGKAPLEGFAAAYDDCMAFLRETRS